MFLIIVLDFLSLSGAEKFIIDFNIVSRVIGLQLDWVKTMVTCNCDVNQLSHNDVTQVKLSHLELMRQLIRSSSSCLRLSIVRVFRRTSSLS